MREALRLLDEPLSARSLCQCCVHRQLRRSHQLVKGLKVAGCRLHMIDKNSYNFKTIFQIITVRMEIETKTTMISRNVVSTGPTMRGFKGSGLTWNSLVQSLHLFPDVATAGSLGHQACLQKNIQCSFQTGTAIGRTHEVEGAGSTARNKHIPSISLKLSPSYYQP